jgi:hypothetical protein
VYANNPHDLEALKQNIHEATDNIQQLELQQVSQICLKEFRRISQQRADILKIYDGEFNINYYISLIINKISKQYVLAAPAMRHFTQEVTHAFAGSFRP